VPYHCATPPISVPSTVGAQAANPNAITIAPKRLIAACSPLTVRQSSGAEEGGTANRVDLMRGQALGNAFAVPRERDRGMRGDES
jgi:hypothetical protein